MDDGLYIDEPTRRAALRISRRLAGSNPRRAAWTELLATVHRLVTRIVDLARRYDTVAHPEFRDVEVEEPIFIVAAPRSGTTFLHRLMCLDERFFYLRLYQTILPAISLFRALDTAEEVDERFGGVLGAAVEAIEETFFSGWNEIHPLGFDRPEEDEGLFVLTLLSTGLYLLFPEIDRLPRPQALDDLEAETRRRVMDFYEGSLKRVKYVEGRGKRFLGKTVLVPGRIRSLLERFPQARFIHLVRHPYRTVPSFVSMFRQPWYAHSPHIEDESPQTRRLADLIIDYYQRMQAAKEQLGDEQVRSVAFEDLVSEPTATIEEIYRWLGLEMTPDFEERLASELAEKGDGGGDHEYSLGQFGLTRGEIHARLRGIFEEYGFEP